MTDATSRQASDRGPPADEIVSVMRDVYGRDVSAFDPTFLARTLTRQCATASSLASDPAEAEAFFEGLGIGHSGFFRDPLAFALLEQLVLPSLAATRETAGPAEIRVWSAGCASGQEAWSVAILLDELARTSGRNIPCRIMATDLSEPRLARAVAGVYTAEESGNVRLRQLRDCFAQEGSTFSVAARLRDLVTFSPFDLLDPRSASPAESIYGGFGLVLCCNVLLYYRPGIQSLILDRLRRSLAPAGFLVVDESERHIVERAFGFRAVAPPSAVFQKER